MQSSAFGQLTKQRFESESKAYRIIQQTLGEKL